MLNYKQFLTRSRIAYDWSSDRNEGDDDKKCRHVRYKILYASDWTLFKGATSKHSNFDHRQKYL